MLVVPEYIKVFSKMQSFPPTVVWRHRKENLKKCSLRGLESREDMRFFSYPKKELPNLDEYVLLDVEGPPLTTADAGKGLVVLDATWRYAGQMRERLLFAQPSLSLRSLPHGLATAYPRRQWDCSSPDRGLASVEAIYAAYWLLGRETDGLLDNYYWSSTYIEKNLTLFEELRKG